MQRKDGFALVTSLLVMLVIAALGVGAVFLSNMNLRIAENTRTQAMARYSAESGMDQSFVILATSVLEEGAARLPPTQAEFQLLVNDWGTTESWEVLAYTHYDGTGLNGADQAQLRIRGTAPRDAQHVVEALIEAVATPAATPGGYTLFGHGFVALDHIDLAGTGTFDIPFWSGGDIDLRSSTLVEGNSALAAGSTCRWGAPPRSCNTGEDPPPVAVPVFSDLRDAVWAAQHEEPPETTVCEGVTETGTTSVGNTSGQLICLAEGATLTVTGNVSDLVIIGDESNTVIIDARTGQPGDDDVAGITVVSGTVEFGGSAAFYGTNTIIAQQDITFGKNVVSHDGTARTFIVTEGNFELRGTGATDIYASFWVGGNFNYHGTPNRFRGTIVAGGTIFGAGCGAFCTIMPPERLENEFVPSDDEATAAGWGVWVLNRR